jgi:hypothetical protein
MGSSLQTEAAGSQIIYHAIALSSLASFKRPSLFFITFVLVDIFDILTNSPFIRYSTQFSRIERRLN